MLVHGILRVPLGRPAPPPSTRACVCVCVCVHAHARVYLMLTIFKNQTHIRRKSVSLPSHVPHPSHILFIRSSESFLVSLQTGTPGEVALLPSLAWLLLSAEHSLCSDSAFLGFRPGRRAVESCFTQGRSEARRLSESRQTALRVRHQSYASNQGRPSCFSEGSRGGGAWEVSSLDVGGSVQLPERTKEGPALLPLFPEASFPAQFITS